MTIDVDSLVTIRGEADGRIPHVVIRGPHVREDDPSGIVYVTVQPQNASTGPWDVPVADIIELSSEVSP
jgi:hypothetical protein